MIKVQGSANERDPPRSAHTRPPCRVESVPAGGCSLARLACTVGQTWWPAKEVASVLVDFPPGSGTHIPSEAACDPLWPRSASLPGPDDNPGREQHKSKNKSDHLPLPCWQSCIAEARSRPVSPQAHSVIQTPGPGQLFRGSMGALQNFLETAGENEQVAESAPSMLLLECDSQS